MYWYWYWYVGIGIIVFAILDSLFSLFFWNFQERELGVKNIQKLTLYFPLPYKIKTVILILLRV